MYGLNRSLSSSTAETSSSPSTAPRVVRQFGLPGIHPRYELVKGWLDIITYKPGWTFELKGYDLFGNAYQDHYVGMLVTKFKAPDTYGNRPGEMMEVQGNHLVPAWILDHQSADRLAEEQRAKHEFVKFVHRCIVEIEHHELDEWFKVGGRLVSNPHDPNDPEKWNGRNERFTKKPTVPTPKVRWVDEGYTWDRNYLTREFTAEDPSAT